MGAVCAGYYAGARLGLVLCDPIDRITLVWPASGVAVAALMRFGLRCWPGIFLAVVLVERTVGHPWGGSFSIACTNTLGSLLAVWILKRLRFDPDFSRGSDGPALALAAVVGMTVTASGGALSLVLTGQIPWAAFAPAWLRWWLGDSGGVLLIAPLLLSFKRENLNPILARMPEFSTLCAAIGFFGWFALLRESDSIDEQYAHAFVMLPLVAWGGIAFRQYRSRLFFIGGGGLCGDRQRAGARSVSPPGGAAGNVVALVLHRYQLFARADNHCHADPAIVERKAAAGVH